MKTQIKLAHSYGKGTWHTKVIYTFLPIHSEMGASDFFVNDSSISSAPDKYCPSEGRTLTGSSAGSSLNSLRGDYKWYLFVV